MTSLDREAEGLGPAGGAGPSSDVARMARGGLINLIGVVAGGLLGFLVVVVVTRGLGTTGSGVFLEAVALFSILSTAVEFGADDGLTRMIARYRALGRVQDLRPTLRVGVIPVLAIGLLVGILLFALAPSLSRALVHGSTVDPEALVPYLRTLAPFICISAASTAMLAASRGFATMVPNAVIGGMGRPAARLLLVSIAVAVGAGSAGIALAWALPVAFTLVAVAVALEGLLRRAERRHQEQAGPPRAPADLAGEFWRFAAPRGLSATFGITVTWLDTLLIGALLTSDRAGIYAAAGRLLALGFLALGPVQMVLAPLMSSLLARGEAERAGAAYRTATVWAMAPSWPIYISLAMFAPVVLRVFGSGFGEGQEVLVILSMAGLVAMTTGPALTVLLMGGRSGWILAVSSVSLPLNVVLNLILIPRLGIVGAAVAWATTIVLNNLIGVTLVRTLMGLSPFGPAAAAVALAAAVSYGGIGLAVRLVFGASLPAFALFAVAATALYVWFLWRARSLLQLAELRSALRTRFRRRGAEEPR